MAADYSFERLEERAADARAAHYDYLALLERQYKERSDYRWAEGITPIAILGMGRAGKDTAAKYVCDRFGLLWPRSSSDLAAPLVAHMIGIDKDLAFAERHQHRRFWIAACHALRGTDYPLFCRNCLAAGDIAVGLRGRMEFDEIVRQKIVHLTIWIDNPRVEVDPTVEFKASDCDIWVPNHGTLDDLYQRLDKLEPLFHQTPNSR